MVTLIIGGNGFTGFWLMKELLDKQVYIADIHPNPTFTSNANYVQNSFLDIDEVTILLRKINPNKIYFLAGIMGDYSLDKFVDINVKPAGVLLKSCKNANLDPRIIFISSGAVYGIVSRTALPLKENSDLNPRSNYGLSKLMMENMVLQYSNIHNIPVIILRVSNLIGPGLGNYLLPGKIVQQTAEIIQGKRKVIEIFNLVGERDYIDVRDAVKQYIAIMSSEKFELIYNISTGKLSSVEYLIQHLKQITEMKLIAKPTNTKFDLEFVSHSQDPSLFQGQFNMEPIISIETSLRDMIDLETNEGVTLFEK